MKVVLAMAMSLNGMIALEDGTEPFLSVAGGELNTKLIREAGGLIWGRHTYENVIMRYNGVDEMDLGPLLKDIPKVVVSRDPSYKVNGDYMLAASPQAAINLLGSKGLREAAVVGGSKLNAAFLAAGLVDELAVIVEPVLVGKGLPLFASSDIEIRAKLLSVEQVNDGELLLKYKVIK
jgi:dihydrofolate reductase